MYKFNNVKEMDKFLFDEFGFGLDENYEDVEKFIDGRNFGLIIDDEEEDMIIEVGGVMYYMVENVCGVKFIEM